VLAVSLQLEQIHQNKGEGSDQPLKPLAEVLRERKEAKQQQFEEGWRQMKIGKNR
jgi:hypothetical protein